MNRKVYYVITKPNNGGTAFVWWNRAGLQVKDDPRTPEQIEAAAVAAGHNVSYCTSWHGMGSKTCAALCERFGYDWEGHNRIAVYDRS